MVKRILSLDGGGVKGVIILKFLQQLEETKQIKIADYFDVFAGTSTGALIATLFAYKKLTASEILETIYTASNFQKIFYQGYYSWALSAFQIRSRYDDIEKLSFIDKYMNSQGEVRLSDIDKPVLITSYCPVEKVPILFRNYFGKPDYLLREVCNATSAAPTYFPIAKVNCPKSSINETSKEELDKVLHSQQSEKTEENQEKAAVTSESFMWLVDGGVFANNPADLAYIDALELFPNEKFKILSIGTGITKSNFQKVTNPSIGGWEWMVDDNIIDLLLDSNQVASHIRTKHLSKKNGDSYLRINEYLHLASSKMDDTTEKNYKKLLEEGELWWRLYKDSEFIREL